MTKAELLKRLENVPDDQEIGFALFDGVTFSWRPLTLNAQYRNDPANIIGLVRNSYMPAFETLEEYNAEVLS